jgi:hypothetical protein
MQRQAAASPSRPSWFSRSWAWSPSSCLQVRAEAYTSWFSLPAARCVAAGAKQQGHCAVRRFPWLVAGELESEVAGSPGKLIRERYKRASEMSRARGKLTCLLINDLDAGIGRFGNTQTTGVFPSLNKQRCGLCLVRWRCRLISCLHLAHLLSTYKLNPNP